MDVVTMTCSCRKWELTGIPCKHIIAACYWNMALNDRATPPPKTWVNPCYWLSTWKKTYSHKIQPIYETNYWEKSTCPTTLLPPKHHVQVGRPKKKRKRSKHEDEPFVKDGKLSRKGIIIACQSCENIGHNNATCKGQGRKATTEGSGSASRQAQQTEPSVGQDGSGGSGVAAGEGGQVIQVVQVLPVKVHPILDGQGEEYKQKELAHKKELPLNLQINLLPVLKFHDNGKFPMVDEEDLTYKKLAPMAEEIILLSEVLKRNYILPYDSHPPVVIAKNMSVVSDNGKFIMVDEEDLIFKKISPMAEEIMVADDWRDTVSYFVKKAVKKYRDDE
ncbi:crooked neck-like protein 1 [Tanacetum coccineum]